MIGPVFRNFPGRILRWCVLVASLVLLLSLLARSGCEPEPPDWVGRQLPELVFDTVDGQKVKLTDYRGRVVVLNFWATWCEPCRQEMPGLQQLSDWAAPRHIAVLGVSVDSDINLVREFGIQYGITFARLIDPQRQIAEIQLGLDGYPQTLIVDPAGSVVGHHRGSRAWSDPQIKEYLLELVRTQEN